jgi:catechol-2,3-dioxygenase
MLMTIFGIEEIFLQVKDMDKAVDFYHNMIGVAIDKRDAERTYLQTENSHVVLQIANHTGRHRGGGPMHFAFSVSEETFDEVLGRFAGSTHFTRGPYGERGEGRALFMIDPDGNESEVNTRYLYGVPKR